jgi:hypothetical protein
MEAFSSGGKRAVNICGMDVCPGEVIHMMKPGGAGQFPADQIENVYNRALRLSVLETPDWPVSRKPGMWKKSSGYSWI